MPALAPVANFLLRFWRPIATGLGSIIAWEQFDSDGGTENRTYTNGITTAATVLLLLFVVGLLTGFLNINKKRKRRRR